MSQSLALFITGVVLLILFAISFHFDKRKFINAILLFLSVVMLIMSLLVFTRNNDTLQSIFCVIFFIAIPLIMLVIIGLLFYDSFLLLKKEGKRIKNLLPALFGFALLVGMIISLLTLFTAFDKHHVLTVFMWLVAILCCYFSFIFVALLVYSRLYTMLPKNINSDYIVVLGCGLSQGEKVTPLLRGRIDKAVEIYEKGERHAKLVLSGGQGIDEKISEAQAMANYLIEKGFTKDNLILEKESVNTYENLKNTRDMLDTPEKKNSYIFVTNDYHVFRASIFARKLGMNAQGVGCHTAGYYWPGAFIREYIAILVQHNLLTIAVILFWAFLAIESFL